MFLVG